MKHKAVEKSGTWQCSCGWKPSGRSLGIKRGYIELTAVSFHVAGKVGRLCICGCEVDYHYAGHGHCKNEVRFMGPPCACKGFRKRTA